MAIKIKDRIENQIVKNGIANTILTNSNFTGNGVNLIRIKEATKKGYAEAENGDGIDISTRMETHRGTVQKGMIQTIKAQIDVGVCVNENKTGGGGYH